MDFGIMDDEKVHVCHVVYGFSIGGLERVIVNSINALGDTNYKHTIIALTKVGDFVEAIEPNVSTYSLHKQAGNDAALFLKTYRLFRQLDIDVLHTYNLPTIEYQLVGALCGIKLRIHAEHGRDSYDVDGSSTKYRLLRRLMSPFIHHFVAVSQDLLGWLQNDVRVPKRKLNLICNGIDTDFFNTSSKRDKKHQDRFVFGHVARLHSIKNQRLLLESFESACDQSEEFRDKCVLVLVGDGPDESSLKQAVNKSTYLSTNVEFCGAQSDVLRFYRMFDVFVMSSLAEGIPMTLLEAMSTELPHIVTAVGGINEVVNGNTGYSVNSGDKEALSTRMLELFHHPERVAEMGIHARSRVVEHYSQTNMVKQYAQLYTMEGG